MKICSVLVYFFGVAACQATSSIRDVMERLTALEQGLTSQQSEWQKQLESLQADESGSEEEKTHYDQQLASMSADIQGLKSTKAALENRVHYLEAITRTMVPRTCHDLKMLGISTSGTYMIDPDGAGIGDDPIDVFCHLDGDEGKTLVNHNLGGSVVEVVPCVDPGCFSAELTYAASEKQIQSLMRLSTECSQKIEFTCLRAPLKEKVDHHMAWWSGPGGEPNYYWDGSHNSSDHICACGAAGTCVSPLYPCNCDSNSPQWLTDDGILANPAHLPVMALYFGGFSSDSQGGFFTLGPLTCNGRMDFEATTSCETLRLAGQGASGYYFLDGASDGHYDLTFCDMRKESSDESFETRLETKLPEYPIAFDALGTTPGTPDGDVLIFQSVLTNFGNAYDPNTSTFTAPVNGIYSFSAFVLADLTNGVAVDIDIKVNSLSMAGAYDNQVDGRDHSTTGTSLVVELEAGDVVWVVKISGDEFYPLAKYSHFHGYLMYPL